MLTRITGVAFALLLAAAPAASQQTITPFLGAGFGAPTGTLGDVSEPGFLLNAGGTLMQGAGPLGWRAEVLYARFGSKRASFFFDGDGFSIQSRARTIAALLGADYELGSRDAPARPYITGGIGFYDVRVEGSFSGGFDGEFESFSGSDSKTSAGLNLGGGVRFRLAGAAVFAEARYHHVTRGGPDYESESAGWKSAGFFPVNLGVKLGR